MCVGLMPTIDLASLPPGTLPGDELLATGVPVDGVDDALGWLKGLEPGPAAMAVLAGIDVATLDRAGRVAVLLAWERANAWVTTQLQAVTVAVGGEEPGTDHDYGRDEVAVALKMSGRGAAQRLHVARMLTVSLPGTRELLESGRIGVRHALAMIELCAPVPADGLAKLEARVLPGAPGQSVAAFRRAIRRAIMRLFPALAEQAYQVARRHRDVVVVPEPHGMATLTATLTAVEARSLFLAVDALARGRHQAEGGRGNGVGIGERRADALAALADAALAERRLPTSHRRPVEVQVMIDLPTLAHLADHPGELVGYGPIPAVLARELAVGGGWRRLVTDPVDGHLLDYGTTVYRPPQPLADYIDARDRTCRVPGCAQPAPLCDHDHALAFEKGGHTSSDNCWALCRRHHRMKTVGRWKVEPGKGGNAVLITATGLRYNLHPPDQRDP